jgi:hypothetical protein
MDMISKRTLRIVFAALSLALLAAGAAQGGAVRTHNDFRAHYVFRGHLLTSPPPNATSVSISVEGGNRIALKTMLGQSVNQSFTVGTGTEFLRWSQGVPTVVRANDLTAGDWVAVHVRAPFGASLSQIESRPAGIVSDRGPNPNPPDKPLYLFRGRLATPAGTSTVTVDVRGGNRRALRLLIGQSLRQSFAYGPETIFLLWQGKVPTVISASQLTVGDRITVRIRAPKGSTLSQVESTPAVHIGEHEPPNTTITG